MVGVPIKLPVLKDHGQLGNARTGTRALGTEAPPASSRRASGPHEDLALGLGEAPRLAPATEFIVVNLVTQHDIEAHEQLPGDGDFRFRPSVPIQHRAVQAFEVGIGADGDVAGLAQHEAEQGVPLLRDVAQPVLVRRRVHRRRQPDVTHDVLAGREALHGSEDQDGAARSTRPPRGAS